MDRLRECDIRRLLATLRDLYASTDLEAFPEGICHILPRVVPGDLTAYNEVHPRLGRAVFRMEPFVSEVAAARRAFEQHLHEHPILRFRDGGDKSACRISDFLTQRQFHQLGLYQEFYRPLGIEYQIAISLPAPRARVFGFTINRARPDFSDRERLLLNLLWPHVVQARQNAEAVSALRDRDHRSRGAITLGSDGRVQFCPDHVRRWLSLYFGRSPDPRLLPDRLGRWVAGQRQRLTQGSEVPPPRVALVMERDRHRLTVRLLSESLGDQCLLLLEERPDRAAGATVPRSERRRDLTGREAEVLHWVTEGKTNKEVATILGLSPLTVRTHLEHIFQKLGVETRTAAAVRALEALGDADGAG